MFAIFNGEQYGYIGSKAFVNDLQNFKCIEYKNETESGDIEYCHYPFRADLHFTNLTLSQFSSILEFNQVGLLTDGFCFFLLIFFYILLFFIIIIIIIVIKIIFVIVIIFTIIIIIIIYYFYYYYY